MARNSAKAILPARPLGLGDVVSAAFKILGARFWFSFGVGVLFVVSIVVINSVPGLVLGIGLAATGTAPLIPNGLALLVGVLMLLSVIVTIVLSIRLLALIIRLAHDTAGGYRPTFADLWGATRGVIRRAISLIAIIYGAYLALIVVSLVIASFAAPAFRTGSLDGAAIALSGLAIFAIWVGSVIISIRLYPLMAVLTLESHSGLGSLKRAWSLTRGRFFRTLGFSLVATAIASAVYLVIYVINLGLVVGVGFNLSAAGQMGAPPQITGAAIGALLIGFAVYMVGTVLILIFGVGYQTVYYIDLARRDEFALAQAAGGYAAAGHGVGDHHVASSWGAGPESAPSGQPFEAASSPGGYNPDPYRPGPGVDDPDSYHRGIHNSGDRGSGQGLSGEQR